MSSSKKKTTPWFECPSCSARLLPRDSTKHTDECGRNPSSLPTIFPRRAMFATTAHVGPDAWQSALGVEALGWHRSRWALVSPATLEVLGIAARSPVLVSEWRAGDEVGQQERCFLIWPSKEVGQLRIALSDVQPERNVRLRIPTRKPTQIHSLPLHVHDVLLASSSSFASYVTAWCAAGAVVKDGELLEISYFGRRVECRASIELNQRVSQLSLSPEDDLPNLFVVSPSCQIVTVQMDGSAGGENRSKPTTPWHGIGGCQSARALLEQHVVHPLQSSQSPRSVLLHGSTGCGKTLLLNGLLNLTAGKCVHADGVEDAARKLDSVPAGHLFIVDLDCEPVNKTHALWPRLARRMATADGLVMVLALRNAEDLELGVRARFALEHELGVPDENERIQIVRILSDNRLADDTVATIARDTHGYTGSDLKALLAVTTDLSSIGSGQELSDRLREARRLVRPSGMRQFILEVPHVSWSDIGGYDALKLQIQQAVVWPRERPDQFARFGLEPISGVLLYGPPGCSKTLIARALASESRMNFLSVKGPELFSKWVGESERAVRELFRRARQVAPTIIFFDEVDAVATARSHGPSSGGSAVGERVLTQLLTELDGLEKSAGILVLAATNRPDVLDAALLRPGRLDTLLYVSLPDEKSRLAIVDIQLSQMPCSASLDRHALVSRTDGYSGAELVAVCRQAALAAMRRCPGDQSAPAELEWVDIESALIMVRPRTRSLTVYEEFARGGKGE